jgi:hypothetical protein
MKTVVKEGIWEVVSRCRQSLSGLATYNLR